MFSQALPRQISSPPPTRPLQRTVRIPLECILIVSLFNYRPRRRSCGKVVFSQVCVKNYVHRGVSASVHAGIHTPSPGQTPPLGRHPRLGRQPPTPHKAEGYCCGRYASYWNAFLMLRMYKIESSNRKTCNHCTSPFWFYTEVFICLVIYSIYLAFLYRLHNVTRHLQYSLVHIFQCFYSYLRFSPLPPRSTLCLQSSFPSRSSHINVRSRFTRSISTTFYWHAVIINLEYRRNPN